MFSRLSKINAFTSFSILSIMLASYSLMLHYNTRATPKKIFELQKVQFSLTEPQNIKKYEVNDVHNKLFDLDLHFIINPLNCDGVKDLLVLILVSSNPINYDKRNAIRNTYGKSTECTRILFLLGENLDSNVTKKIEDENATFNDIIQGNFIDAYKNMTYKHVMGLKWAAHHCPAAKYVLKVDDDVVVNTAEIPRFLTRELSPFGADKLMLCHPHWKSVVVRDNTSKWYVSGTEIPGEFYPPYCFGPFILYSKDVVISLLENSQKMPYFYIDDAFLTGIVAEKVGITPTDIGSQFLNQNLIDLKNSTGKLPKFLMGPWELNAQQMISMWKAIE